VIEHTEQVALGIAEYDEVGARWIRPILHAFRADTIESA
jgi:hypothetical protein